NKADLCNKSSIFIETEPTNLETFSLDSINDSSLLKINEPPKNVKVNKLAKDVENEPVKDIKNEPAKDVENESSDEESDNKSLDMLEDKKQYFENEDIYDKYMDKEEHFINDNIHLTVDTNT
ncbi:12688_t:CDS:2, partial [Racocetra persica]